VPVWTKSGQCPNERYHFHGAARELFGYLQCLGKNHGGFVFAQVPNITKHMKNWNKGKHPFTQRHCERLLRMFRELQVISDRRTCVIRGRRYSGWELLPHGWWAEAKGGQCDFKHVGDFEKTRQQFMGNAKCELHQQNVGENVGGNVGDNVGGGDETSGKTSVVTSVSVPT
jgi:hypothetical protein